MPHGSGAAILCGRGNAACVARKKSDFPSNLSGVKAELRFLLVEKTPLVTQLSCSSSASPPTPTSFPICTGASYRFSSLPCGEMPFRDDHPLVCIFVSVFPSWGFISGPQPLFLSSPLIPSSTGRNVCGRGEGCQSL